MSLYVTEALTQVMFLKVIRRSISSRKKRWIPVTIRYPDG